MVGRDAWIAVYIMTNQAKGTLYTGVTSRLLRRVWEHRTGALPGFTKTYGLKRLVWYEIHDLMTAAIHREKLVKHWPREWKMNLVERGNPNWDDLYPVLVDWTPVPPQI
jgi:putative endonuclease